MYPLLPWRWLGIVLTVVVALAVYADDVGRLTSAPIPDHFIIRFLPLGLLLIASIIFAPTCYCAPWRILWRTFPGLNARFPDLNGVWVGATNSNWPTIKMLVDAAQSKKQVTEQQLHDTLNQSDAIVIRITNSLFTLRIEAYLSSTNGESYTITAKPWRDQHTQKIHLSYVYGQQTPNPASTDEETHLGAADLVFSPDDLSKAEGTYWTRRSWQTGRNTAGTLSLRRVSKKLERKKSLKQFAAEQKDALLRE